MVEPPAGAGPLESFLEMGASFGEVDGAGDIAGMVLNTAAFTFDGLGFLANPIDTLAHTTISYLIEHIAFLRGPLDFTAGDPAAIQHMVRQWNDTALMLDRLADEQRDALAREVPTFLHGGGSSVPAFEKAMTARERQLRGAGMTCAEIAREIAATGAWTAGIRGVIRDVIAELVWDILKQATAKLAVAPLTFGATAAELAANVVLRAAAAMKKIGGKLDELVDYLGLATKRLKTLSDRFNKYLKLTTRVTKTKDVPTVFWGAVPKAALDVAREMTKVDTNEVAVSGHQPTDDIEAKHRMLDDPDYQRREQARDETRGEPESYETDDWWTRRGTL